jgi:hypothetical protein
MMRLGLNPGAAVEAAALARGVGAPGGEVGTLLLLSCLIEDKARVRVSTGLGFWARGARDLSPEGLDLAFVVVPLQFLSD